MPHPPFPEDSHYIYSYLVITIRSACWISCSTSLCFVIRAVEKATVIKTLLWVNDVKKMNFNLEYTEYKFGTQQQTYYQRRWMEAIYAHQLHLAA